jgi:hypothetical protein
MPTATADDYIVNRAGPKKALRRLLLKTQQRGEEITFSDVFAACPFRSVIGITGGHLNEVHAIDHLGAMIVVTTDEASQIDARAMVGVQAALAAGRSVLILATEREIRDRVKSTILGMALPVRGAAWPPSLNPRSWTDAPPGIGPS